MANNAPIDATINSVTDIVSPDVAAKIVWDGNRTFPYILPAGQTLKGTWTVTNLPDTSTRTDTATVTLQNNHYASDGTATPISGKTTDFSGTAQVAFSDQTSTITQVHPELSVSDPMNGTTPWVVKASDLLTNPTLSYTHTIGPYDTAGTNTISNTATSTYTDEPGSTGPSATVSTTVNVYSLDVQKTASTSFDRTWTWGITKTVLDPATTPPTVTLAVGQTNTVKYEVKPTATSADGNWQATGTITVTAPKDAPDATINSASDVIKDIDSSKITVDWGSVTFPYTLKAGDTLTGTWKATLPDASTRTNTATVTLQNYRYETDGSKTALTTTKDFSGTAQVVFSSTPTNTKDQFANLADSFWQVSPTWNPVDATKLSVVWDYQHDIGPFTASGTYYVKNTATVTATDTGAQHSADATVKVNVPASGCSVTIGYWKTHAGFGPQHDVVTKLLPIWLGTSGGAKSVQVTSAAQAVTILSFNGDASNGINKLDAQLLGAKLNIKNGADGTALSTTITSADQFLATHNSASWSSLSKTQQQQVLAWMNTLDSYNQGLIGPGHCSAY